MKQNEVETNENKQRNNMINIKQIYFEVTSA